MASCWILLRGDSLTLNLVGFYAGLNLIAWGMIFCFVRETKQLTLEEIDRKLKSRPTYLLLMLTSPIEVFSIPTKQFISYESKVWLPYFIKRHIFRQNIVKPPPIIERGELAEKADYA